MTNIVCTWLMLIFVGQTASPAVVPHFDKQVLESPEGKTFWIWGKTQWADVDGDGRAAIIAASGSGQLHLYRQCPNGYPAKPTQKWKLPDGAVWFLARDIDACGKCEILAGCSDGIACYRQKGGVFSILPFWLVSDRQVFDKSARSFFDGDHANKIADRLPILLSDHVQWYELNGKNKPRLGPKTPLQVNTALESGSFSRAMPGSQESFWMNVTTSAKEKDLAASEKAKKDQFVEELARSFQGQSDTGNCSIDRKDINGDGREDVALWVSNKDLEPRTTWYFYLRHPDGTLASKADQVLRTRGWPMSEDRSQNQALVDVNGDGKLDLVMREMKKTATTFSGLLKNVLTDGMDWVFTIRLFDERKGFASQPSFRLPVHMAGLGPVTLDGDFNGDGRPDFLVRADDDRYVVYLSSKVGPLYDSNPAIRFDVPFHVRNLNTRDLNGDGISDLAAVDSMGGQLIVFLSKGTRKDAGK